MNIYKPYCVYLTTYIGNKLPPFYIGSGITQLVLDGKYKGSVKSKKYKKIWTDELINNPHLFTTKIVSTYDDRIVAMERECFLQIKLKVVTSDMYINMSVAKNFGWFGMKNDTEFSPAYGKQWKKTPEQIENNKKAMQRIWSNPEHLKKMSDMRKGKLPCSKQQAEERLQKYSSVMELYKSRPLLTIKYNYVAKNGKFLTYENAFSKEFHTQFGYKTAKGLQYVLTKDSLIKKIYENQLSK